MRILIIDDNELDRKAVKRALKQSNLFTEIEETSDAKSAISLLSEMSFDCLLLDYQLPDMDGLELARQLQDDDKIAGVPIVMLTGKGSETVAVEAMKLGVQDYLCKSNISPGSLSRTISNAVDITELHNKIDEMNKGFEHMALNDSLTGLGNRNLFTDRLNSLIATSRRSNEPFSLLMMDLDKFKEVNDTHGHEAGDHVLREVGKRLATLGRDADSFFRLGGDEFTALVTTGVTPEGGVYLAERIIQAVETPIEFESIPLEISVSIGIVFYPEHSEDGDELLRIADAAMYEAKHEGLGFTTPPVTK